MKNKKMKGRKLLVLFLCLLLAGCSLAQPAQEKEMSNLEFFQSLNYDDGLSVLEAVFDRFGMQYATTLGLDGAPQIRPIEFKFEKDGVLYFDTVTFYTSYYELQNYPYIQICIGDQETMSYVRLSGKVNFTQDEEVIERCFEESPVLTSQFGNKKEVVIGYYLSDVTMEFRSFEPTLSNYDYKLPTPYDSEEEQ